MDDQRHNDERDRAHGKRGPQQRDDLRGSRDPRRERDIAEGRFAGTPAEQETRARARRQERLQRLEGGKPGGEAPEYKHEDPDIRGTVDRGSDEDNPRESKPRVNDDLAEEPGIGP